MRAESNQGVAGENFVAYAMSLIDAMGSWVARTENRAAGNQQCESCPVCAVIAFWHGDHSALAPQWPERIGQALAVLRTALSECAGPRCATDDHNPDNHNAASTDYRRPLIPPTSPATTNGMSSAHHQRRVQRITVESQQCGASIPRDTDPGSGPPSHPNPMKSREQSTLPQELNKPEPRVPRISVHRKNGRRVSFPH